MVFIIESGSTKSDWMLLEKNQIREYSTMGYNPCFHDSQTIIASINKQESIMELSKQVTKVFFYGAGCSSKKMNDVLQQALSSIFSNASVVVDHDLKACAYATYRGNPTVSCILGTGSNSCFFDGDTLVDLIPALGYVLGDEGSGSYFGKKLLSSFLYKKLPKEIEQDFLEKFDLNSEKIIERVYQEGNANVYLASFMPFIASHKENKFIQEMIKEGFKNFINTHVLCYENIEKAEVNFVGSISSVFENELKEVAKELKINVGQIIRKPAESLVNYHKKYLL